jgi:hypothetical protein
MRKEVWVVSVVVLVAILLYGFVEEVSLSPGEKALTLKGKDNFYRSEIFSNYLEGTYGVSIVDNFQDKTVEYLDYINSKGKIIYLKDFEKPAGLGMGDRIKVKGGYSYSGSEKYFVVSESEKLVDGKILRSNVNPVLGEQKTAVIVINWDGVPEGDMYTKQDIYDEILA